MKLFCDIKGNDIFDSSNYPVYQYALPLAVGNTHFFTPFAISLTRKLLIDMMFLLFCLFVVLRRPINDENTL